MAKTRTLSRQVVHSNPWYKIRHDEVIFPDGNRGNWYVMERGPFCLIVAEDADRFLMVEEDRYTTGTRVLDFPGGWIESGENPLTSAVREFEEETGHRAKELKLLSAPYSYVGISNTRSFIFQAIGPFEKVGQRLESSEAGLKTHWLTRVEIAESLKNIPEASGDILKCIAAYDMFR